MLALVLVVFWPFLIIARARDGHDLAAQADARAPDRLDARARSAVGTGHRAGNHLVILIPVLGVLATIAAQALNFYQWVAPRLTSRRAGRVVEHSRPVAACPGSRRCRRSGEGRIADFLAASADADSQAAANNLLQGAVAGLTRPPRSSCTLLLIMLYFFLRDGEQFRAQIRRVSPLSRRRLTI